MVHLSRTRCVVDLYNDYCCMASKGTRAPPPVSPPSAQTHTVNSILLLLFALLQPNLDRANISTAAVYGKNQRPNRRELYEGITHVCTIHDVLDF